MRYVSEYDSWHGTNLNTSQGTAGVVKEVAEDPVLSLVTTRRLAKDWPVLRDAPVLHHWLDVVEGAAGAEVGVGVVMREEDLDAHTHALMRLQHVYNLHAAHLVHPTPHGPALRVSDVVSIGIAALDNSMYGRAVEWLSAALQHTHRQGGDGDGQHKWNSIRQDRQTQQLNILLHLSTAVHDHQLTKENHDNHPGNYPLPLSQVPLEVQKQEENKVLESQEMETSDVISSTPRDKQVLSLLCRGHTLLTASESSHLKCHVGSRGSPWLRLMPVKVEEHSLDPAILSFHDLFLPHQLAVLRQLSRPLLEQARVQGADKSLTYMYRSSYNAWLRGPTHPVVRAVNHMIAALTGLEMDEDKEEAELLQTNLYGAGGHYIPHMDFLALYRSLWESDNPVEKLMKEFPNGDRVATFMIYMNKVEEGGRTAFPRVGVSVEPREGSAVFWYNLLPSGKGDLRMLHAACPVLRGTKWVSNKWIKHYPQMYHRPCLPLAV
ncbi:prolyl 4-hydroxylase subunit alpha-2-like [Homarus americanus]|uniref:prolyl 4-hydroxylase subunit alpha-2-like n=1 Tax=Homarus americanus TaxID=6706 RepID=UPI001C46526D|nr:prolyl 4-hydroxylase subunit alpha-2-like [Homarus americanus]